MIVIIMDRYYTDFDEIHDILKKATINNIKTNMRIDHIKNELEHHEIKIGKQVHGWFEELLENIEVRGDKNVNDKSS